MPTYEYACRACGHGFEVVQSFSEDALTTCPECREDQLRKVFSAAGIIFKGDGWHIKDYGTSKSSSSAGSSTAGDGDKGDKGSGSTDGAASGSGAAKKKAKGDGGSAAVRPAAS